MDFKGFLSKIKDSVAETADLLRKKPEGEGGGVDENGIPIPASPPPPDPATGSGRHVAPPSGAVRTPPQPGPTAQTTRPFPNVKDPSSSQSPLVVADQDDSVYAMRDQLVQAVQSMFGEFGAKVSSYMLTQALTPGGLARTVKKLGLHSRGRDGADMAQIEAFLRARGAEEFARVTGIRLQTESNPDEGGRSPVLGDPTGKLRVKPISVHVSPKRVEVSPDAGPQAPPAAGVPQRDPPTSPKPFQKAQADPRTDSFGDSSPKPRPSHHGGAPKDPDSAAPSHLSPVSLKPLVLKDPPTGAGKGPADTGAPPASSLPPQAPPTANSANDFLLKEIEESSRRFPPKQ